MGVKPFLIDGAHPRENVVWNMTCSQNLHLNLTSDDSCSAAPTYVTEYYAGPNLNSSSQLNVPYNTSGYILGGSNYTAPINMTSVNGTNINVNTTSMILANRIEESTWLYNVKNIGNGIVAMGPKSGVSTFFQNSTNITNWMIEVG